jgi:hypothetical protein
MKNIGAEKPEEQGQNSTFSLERERRRIRIMKFLLGGFAIILILVILLTPILNR